MRAYLAPDEPFVFAASRLAYLPHVNQGLYILLHMMRPALVSILALSLTACGGRDVAQPSGSGFKSESSRACLSTLKSTDARFTPLPDKLYGGGCKTIDAVKLMSFATEATNLGPMTCPLASSFAAWAKHAVRPAAKQYLGSDVVRIETMGTYSCRNIGGGGRLSEHARGNAVDVSAFILKDGRRVSVLSGWRGKEAERNFLRRLHQSACKRFGTVLGPDYNAAHANHLHFDMAKSMKNGSAYCR